MKSISSLIILGAFIAIYSCNGVENGDKMAKEENAQKFDSTDIKPDVKFLTEMVSTSTMEIQLGNIALSNGSLDDIKQFAQKMIDDHTKANIELVSLAQSKDISLPSSIDNNMQKKIDEMKQKNR